MHETLLPMTIPALAAHVANVELMCFDKNTTNYVAKWST